MFLSTKRPQNLTGIGFERVNQSDNQVNQIKHKKTRQKNDEF